MMPTCFRKVLIMWAVLAGGCLGSPGAPAPGATGDAGSDSGGGDGEGSDESGATEPGEQPSSGSTAERTYGGDSGTKGSDTPEVPRGTEEDGTVSPGDGSEPSASSSAEADTSWPTAFSAPDEDIVLGTLLPFHPRLIVLDEDLAEIQALIDSDPVAKGYFDAVTAEGDELLDAPVSVRKLNGPRLLEVSRTVLRRISTLALLYRSTHEAKYLDRAKEELIAVADFSDWNPSHFLDVAEMTHAFAIGYDWLFDALSESDRVTVRQALVDKGLKEAEKAYAGGAWWAKSPFNWNLVCNGGISVGALAIADEEPELAGALLSRAIEGMPLALASYAPDGAWAEGPGYWGYATQYAVAALSALHSALGTDFGLSSHPGVSRAGHFRVASVGPTNLFFNFADGGEKAGSDPSLFWLGKRFSTPLYAWAERKAVGSGGSARDVWDYDPSGTEAELLAEPSDVWFHGADVVFLRSSWGEAEPTFIGFKGGDNGANHSHLDLGTFVLDASGQRWAVDLGGDDYNLPGYFGKERFTYYRLMTEGHNTIVVGGENQDEKAKAPIISFGTAPDGSSHAIAELIAAYEPQGLTKAERGFALLGDRHRALVVDELAAEDDRDVMWAMHTRANVEIQGEKVVLTRGGKTLTLEALAGDGEWKKREVSLEAPQKPTDGVVRLERSATTGPGGSTFAVLFTPEGAEGAAVKPRPLADWQLLGPVE